MNVTGKQKRGMGSALAVLWMCAGLSGCAQPGDTLGDGVVEVDVQVQALQVQIFSDELENDLSQWTTTGVVYQSSSAAYSGSYGGRADDSASMTASFSTSGYSDITVSWYRRTAYYDGGEQLIAEWSADGTNWNLIEATGQNSTYTLRSFTLPSGANNLSSLSLRFRSTANGWYERFEIDEVTVTGEDGCVPSCSGKSCGNDGCGGNCGYCSAGEACSDTGECEWGPAPPAIFSSTFDSGYAGWNIYEYDCDNNSASAASGAAGIRCGDAGWLYADVDLTGYEDIIVEYRRRTTDNYETGEYFYAEYSVDSYHVSWTELEKTHQDTTYNYVSHRLPASVAGDPDFRLRFRSNTSNVFETFDVDDVVVRGLSTAGCTADCSGKSCGGDGCGGSCGSCGSGDSCVDGSCQCVPNCGTAECGDDGCGGSCGTCGGTETCTDGACVGPSCTPDCSGKECGDDGCGGTCGSCNASESCSAGACVCTPDCSGKSCGPDGCGGSCGSCSSGQSCDGGSCSSSVDDPSQTGPHSVCTYTSGLSDGGYSSAIVHYPCSLSGTVGATTLTGGYTNTKEQMAWLGSHVASHGFIVIAMTPTNRYGGTSVWQTAHRSGHAKLLSETNRSASPIYGHVDPARTQIMGFSKGGGGTLRAAEDLGTSIATAQALAPWMESSLRYTNWDIDVPTVMYTGEDDTIAQHAYVRTFFDNLPTNIDRLFVRFDDASHTQWYGNDSSSNAKDRSRFKTHVVAWMKVYLDGDSGYQSYIDGSDYSSQASAGWYQNPNGSGTSDDYTYITP